MRRRGRLRVREVSIPDRARQIMRYTGAVFIVIIARLWFLSVVEHEDRLEVSRRPQRRVVIEHAERGTIRDRFNVPLAVNEVQYNAAVLYAPVLQIPSVAWSDGKRVYPRREHVARLGELLADILSLDSVRTEDLIHSRAALFPYTPFVIKRDITEAQYYRLRMLEKDWPGVCAERSSRRVYPMGRVACDIVGYVGAIDRERYDRVAGEIQALRAYLSAYDRGEWAEPPEGMDSPAEARRRLRVLSERAYGLNDVVGRVGIEKTFDEELKGYIGKKIYVSDARGHFVRELPGARHSVPGQRLLLSISSELQQFCEKLLVANERIRDGLSTDRAHSAQPQPWIKGGSIVAMDPRNGELLAMASHPRFDPNDFIATGSLEGEQRRKGSVLRWLELERHIGRVWDGRALLEREEQDGDVGKLLRWPQYLAMILPDEHPIRTALQQKERLQQVVPILAVVEELCGFTGLDPLELVNLLYTEKPYRDQLGMGEKEEAREALDRAGVGWQRETLDEAVAGLDDNYDKLLFLDLCRLVVYPDAFPPSLLRVIGDQTLTQYRDAAMALAVVNSVVFDMTRELFSKGTFQAWRQREGREFLREMRADEARRGTYQRPYLDHFDREEARQYNEFWLAHRVPLITLFLTGESDFSVFKAPSLRPYVDLLSSWEIELAKGANQSVDWIQDYSLMRERLRSMGPDLSGQFLDSIRFFEDLDEPLWGRYRNLRNESGKQLERHLASAFYPVYGFGYGRSYAFRQAAVQGSLFKVVTGYAALLQKYKELLDRVEHPWDLSPLEIVDQPMRIPGSNKWTMGTWLDGRPIPQIYKGGRLIKTLSRNIGRTDFLTAMERSSNPYFSLLAGDVLSDPDDLNAAASGFSFGQRTGIALPGEISGRLPTDLHTNRSGLYAYAIGQHSLVVTPLQTAVMLSSVANGGEVLIPKILSLSAGTELERNSEAVFKGGDFPYRDRVAAVGLDFPLFSEAVEREHRRVVKPFSREAIRSVEMPNAVRDMLLSGMRRVVAREQSVGQHHLAHVYRSHPAAVRSLLALGSDLVGKSSTAESVESVMLDREGGTGTYNHVWFGGLAFRPPFKGDSDKDAVIAVDSFERPEIVVVVYLRYGGLGQDGSPLAAQVIEKWREIQNR